MITEQQRLERKNHIGASEISALFVDPDTGKSLNPFLTASDVWASKCFDFEDAPATDAQDRGNRYEAALIEFAAEQLNQTLITKSDELGFICKAHPILACTLDAFTDDVSNEIVEAKTTGLTGEWGEPGTDQVPFRVLLQVQHQMICTGCTVANIVVLMGKWGLKEEMYRVEANDAIQQAIITRAEQFWNDYVLTKTPPPDCEPGNIELFKRIIRMPETTADVPVEIITAWETIRKSRLEIENMEKRAFADVLLHLMDAEGAPAGDGRMLTYFKQRGTDKIDRDALKSKYPEVYAEVATPTEHRVARIIKPKK